MAAARGTSAKRLIKTCAARRVHTGMETMYRAINKSINDDDGGLNPGSALSRNSAHRRRVGRPEPTNSHTRQDRLAPTGSSTGEKMIYSRCVSSAYPETGLAQYSTRKMTAREHHVHTRCDLRITVSTQAGAVIP